MNEREKPWTVPPRYGTPPDRWGVRTVNSGGEASVTYGPDSEWAYRLAVGVMHVGILSVEVISAGVSREAVAGRGDTP